MALNLLPFFHELQEKFAIVQLLLVIFSRIQKNSFVSGLLYVNEVKRQRYIIYFRQKNYDGNTQINSLLCCTVCGKHNFIRYKKLTIQQEYYFFVLPAGHHISFNWCFHMQSRGAGWIIQYGIGQAGFELGLDMEG